jgi:hypothetical protein
MRNHLVTSMKNNGIASSAISPSGGPGGPDGGGGSINANGSNSVEEKKT